MRLRRFARARGHPEVSRASSAGPAGQPEPLGNLAQDRRSGLEHGPIASRAPVRLPRGAVPGRKLGGEPPTVASGAFSGRIVGGSKGSAIRLRARDDCCKCLPSRAFVRGFGRLQTSPQREGIGSRLPNRPVDGACWGQYRRLLPHPPERHQPSGGHPFWRQWHGAWSSPGPTSPGPSLPSPRRLGTLLRPSRPGSHRTRIRRRPRRPSSS
jgi:hypothetical protein